MARSPAAPEWRPRLLLYGVLLITLGLVLYLAGVLMVIPRRIFGLQEMLLPFNTALVWYSGMPIVLGIGLGLVDLLVLLRRKRRTDRVVFRPLTGQKVTVALTAYNDEASIADAVRDFFGHPAVARVIVVSNNSRDATLARAIEAGAIGIDETAQGYGRCVFRCLQEALTYDDTDMIVLCEGDRTFRAYDIDKLLAYAPHADIVNGTRTVEALREHETQLTTFMYYGNLFVGKLLEAKHVGRSTLTDVGTTYKLCHRVPLERLLTLVNPAINLEFNAHFLDTAIENGFLIVECPITFHPRVGVSKGGNVSNRRATMVGFRMIKGIVFGWRA
jgi:hypothetical protein